MKINFGPTGLAALVVTVCLISRLTQAATPTETVSYGIDDPDRQKLHIYQAPRSGLKPVYVWAHPRVGGTQNVPNTSAGIDKAHDSKATLGMVDALNEAGISVVSWGSYPFVNNKQEFLICIQDSFKMYAWIIENADMYNWDTGRLIVGGNSRGSIVSWELAHSNNRGIIGIHSQQALPDGAWGDLEAWNPLSFIHKDSPPFYFAYASKPNIEDNHDPLNGIAVVNEYRRKGIGNRANLGHTLGFQNMTNNIVPFCQKLISEIPNK